MSEDTKDNNAEEARIPYARFKQANEARKAAEEARTQLNGQLEAAQAQLKAFEEMAAAKAAVEQQMTQMRSDLDMERAMMHRGILDAEGVQFTKMAYNMIEGDKPAFNDWLTGDTLPRAVQAYIPQAAPSAPVAPQTQAVAPQATPAQPVPAPQPAVTANAGTATQPHYQGTVDYKAAAQNPEYYKQNKHLFVTEDGFLKR